MNHFTDHSGIGVGRRAGRFPSSTAVLLLLRKRRASGSAPDGSDFAPATKPKPDDTLKALARAWRWQKLLDAGIYISVSEIGDTENISKSYVSRTLRLALLAPDVVEAIQAGRTDQVVNAGEAGAAAAGELGGAALPDRPHLLVG